MKNVWYVVMIAVAVMGLFFAMAAGPGKDKKTPAAPAAKSPAKGGLATETDKLSYAIGTQIGRSIKTGEVKLNIPALARGIEDVVNDKPLALTQDEIKDALLNFQNAMMKGMAGKNLAEVQKFLSENAKKPGVKTLPDGLQYKVIKEGSGPTPKATDKVKVNYRGTFINGQEFDSSYKRGQPAEFGVTEVIAGWTEALQKMKVGSKWELYIPPKLAYGEAGRPGVPPNSLLIFDLELLDIVKDNATAPK